MIKQLQKFYVVLPIAYLFISIFLVRSQVLYVYIAAAILVGLTVLVQFRQKTPALQKLAQWMLVLAAIGISAAVILSIEKIEILSQPNHIASCSLSPVVACSPVIKSPQASAFGFPNPFIGIFGFTAVFTAGMTILAGASKLTKAWWRTLLGGIVFGAGFSSWLFYQGVFVIGKLCLYCMLVWLVTSALLWLVTAYCIDKKYINLGALLNRILVNKRELITFTYVVIFAMILFRWSDYWFSLIS